MRVHVYKVYFAKVGSRIEPFLEKHDLVHHLVKISSYCNLPRLRSMSDVVENEPEDRKKAKFKYGIIYMSYIPEGLNVRLIHEIMSQHGEVGRIYLEPEVNNKKRRTYIEGWVEFKKKRVAKSVAEILNGTPLKFGRKHNKINGQVWSVKYLHRFKWAHLTEQLAHDRAVNEQKRRFELNQAKKHVDFYQKMTEKSKRMRKSKSDGSENDDKLNTRRTHLKSKQNKPVEEGNELEVPVDEDLLNSIFRKVS